MIPAARYGRALTAIGILPLPIGVPVVDAPAVRILSDEGKDGSPRRIIGSKRSAQRTLARISRIRAMTAA